MNATTESPPFPGSLRRSLEDRRYSPACHCTDCECARTRIFLTARTPCLAQVFDSSAQDDATYIHHLVHMREGQFPGEFGTGWNNAGFWAGSVDDHPTFPQLQQASVLIAQESIPEIACDLQQEGWSLPTFIKSVAPEPSARLHQDSCVPPLDLSPNTRTCSQAHSVPDHARREDAGAEWREY